MKESVLCVCVWGNSMTSAFSAATMVPKKKHKTMNKYSIVPL